MNILGLHFGHDASVALVRDGQVVGFLEKERKSRIKHAAGLDFSDVTDVLDEAGVSVDQIDYCAVTTTQVVDYFFFDPENLSFTLDPGHDGPLRSLVTAKSRSRSLSAEDFPVMGLLQRMLEHGRRDDPFARTFAQYHDFDRSRTAVVGPIEPDTRSAAWKGRRTLGEIAGSELVGAQLDRLRRAFHLPISVRLGGRSVPGCVFGHHYAHAAYGYYESPFGEAAILAHDGAGGWSTPHHWGGFLYYAKGSRLFPLIPHRLKAGPFYVDAARLFGFDMMSGPGKLMGLAAYGKPRFAAPDFTGNFNDGPRKPGEKTAGHWAALAMREAKRMGRDLSPLGDLTRLTEPLPADLAASVQLMFEETILGATGALHGLLRRNGIDTPNLCMTGGTALNCPANTRVMDQGHFTDIFIGPGSIDSGLSIGAAHALYYNILEAAPFEGNKGAAESCAFLGRRFADDAIDRALSRHGDTVRVARLPDPAGTAAALLADDHVIGWFEGRSELGPRALGHRSILANPLHAANWHRVNRIKGREAWRPFAPAVPEDKAGQWFRGGPPVSPFMLFTAQVASDRLPAITHRDGSARIQTVSPRVGRFYDLLCGFERLSGTPVVLNTSFNGPGEPIVESPDDALAFFVSSDLDALFLEDRMVLHATSDLQFPEPSAPSPQALGTKP